ncbi:hypothetical protein QTP88_010241 [Uroleucon formosanum]
MHLHVFSATQENMLKLADGRPKPNFYFLNHYKYFKINVLKIPSEFISTKSLLQKKNIVQPDLNLIIDTPKKLPGAFSETLKILQNINTLNTLPVSERLFSLLKRVKSYLRSSMGDERLSDLIVIAVEKEGANKINLDEAVDRFSKLKSRSGFAKRKLKLQKEEQTKKLAGSLIRFIKPNSLVVSDTLPAVAVHTDAYIVNKNEDINLETNNVENNAIEYIECETNSETSETEIKMDDSNDFINTSSDDFDSSDESEKCEIESNFTTNEVISAPNPTYNSIDEVISGPGNLSQILENGPNQPKLVYFPKTMYGNQMRHFSLNWYKLYNWIEYSIINDSIFCFPCQKNALDSNSGLKKHHMSNDYKTSHAMWTSYLDMKKAGNVSVASLINDGHLKLVKENHNFIKSIGRVLLYTAIQGIAQRCDNEGESSLNRGNFVELLNLVENFNNEFKSKRRSLPNNAKYISPQIQNEMLSIFNDMIQAIISDEIQKSQYFSIIVDETKDISKIEQISVVIRYFLNGIIYERFMGYRAAESLCAKSLLVYIKEIIANSNIDIMKCVSQTYDGASVMS